MIRSNGKWGGGGVSFYSVTNALVLYNLNSFFRLEVVLKAREIVDEMRDSLLFNRG